MYFFFFPAKSFFLSKKKQQEKWSAGRRRSWRKKEKLVSESNGVTLWYYCSCFEQKKKEKSLVSSLYVLKKRPTAHVDYFLDVLYAFVIHAIHLRYVSSIVTKVTLGAFALLASSMLNGVWWLSRTKIRILNNLYIFCRTVFIFPCCEAGTALK